MNASIALILGAALLFACGGKDQPQQDSGTAPDTRGTIDTSGMSDTATGDGANATCSSCVMSMCGTQLGACQGDTACSCTYNCIINGGAEGSCKSQCNLAGNNMGWADLIDCIDANCMTACQ